MRVEESCERPFNAILFVLNGTHDRVPNGAVWASILTDKLIGDMHPDQFFYVQTKKNMAERIYADREESLS